MEKIQLKAVHLSKEYKMGSEIIHALNDVQLSIEEGSFTAIVGTSGSGKSTLLHMLGGLDKPTTGEVYMEDTRITGLREKELTKIRRDWIGFVFQKFCLIPELTVLENIVLPILLSGKKPDNQEILGICDVLGLNGRLRHLPSELSGGQQQRVAVARALANNPKMILCDEPTGNLDKKTGNEVVRLLHEVNEKFHKTILIVTHDAEIAAGAQRKIQIEDGTLL